MWAFRNECLTLNDAVYRISNIEDIIVNNPNLDGVEFEASRHSLFNEEL